MTNSMIPSIFESYLSRWNLTTDGEAIITHTSRLLPVRFQDKPAMLKIAIEKEERLGNQLMIWWDGQGAAPVFMHDDHAIVMARALDASALVNMAKKGEDEKATRIICDVTNKLHAIKKEKPPPVLLPLSIWFSELAQAASTYGGIFQISYQIANELLLNPQEMLVLHGDIHHGNILYFGEYGFLAIDPKHIMGGRGYDFANIFCNPNSEIALQPGRFEKQVKIVSFCAKIETKKLLQWVAAYAGLSAAWSLHAKEDAQLALSIAEMAVAQLKQ